MRNRKFSAKLFFMLSPLVLIFLLPWSIRAGHTTGPEASSKPFIVPSPLTVTRPVLGPGESNAIQSKQSVSSQPALAPLTGSEDIVDLNVLTPTNLVTTLLGTGPSAPQASNISFTGANRAAGKFTNINNYFSNGFNTGIVLSSGNILSVIGPNIQDATTTNNGTPGDPALDELIPGRHTLDASVLEFDLECPGGTSLAFDYVFSSEEYNEFVGSVYNDVFGFFVNGVNIALIPNSSLPVSVNNINCGNPYNPPIGNHCDLFVNNDPSDGTPAVNTEMDGFTSILTATAPLHPGLNRIRLAIADASDTSLDSNILLKSGSFTCNHAPVAVCKNVTTYANQMCTGSASIDDGSTDPDEDPIVCTQSPSSPYALGFTSVTLTCTDPHAAQGSCEGVVNVIDNTPPVFTFVPGDITTTDCGKIETGLPLATDNCTVVQITSDQPASFDPGTTLVTWTAVDGSGNQIKATQRVTRVLTDNPACCPVGSNIILGTPNNDVLNGTAGSDCILGFNSQDTINGKGGRDFISGGEGNDIIYAGAGDDVVFAGTGQDKLYGQDGQDYLDGGEGDDQCSGGIGNDHLLGGQGQDQLYGEEGNDVLVGNSGDDKLDGGPGDDILDGSGLHDKCYGGAGNDSFLICELKVQ